MSEFYNLSAVNNKGQTVQMSDFKGKPVLIFNSASSCSFTTQLSGLQELHKKYSDRGLQVIGFPCNQFASQDSGTDEEIQSFCSLNFGVTFPMMKKSDVNGAQTNDVFKWLKSQKSQLGSLTCAPEGNFEKFLVDAEGKVVSRYSSITKPENLEADIEKLLPAGAPKQEL